jgi:hypothetical protein
MASTVKTPKNYENNPFFIAANGISLLFDLARGLSILFIILSILSLFTGNWSGDEESDRQTAEAIGTTLTNWSVSEWLTASIAFFIIILALALISALFGGVSAYTSAQLAKGKPVKFGEAFRVAFEHLWSFLWLQIIVSVKTLLWTLLFIVPGIIMAIRYSLAGVAFYDSKKNLRGNAAVKESIRMTRGAWITTYAAGTLFNIITLGIISWLVKTGANTVLYRQFEESGETKPAAHWLSWLTLILPFIFILLLVLFVIFIAVVIGLSGGKFSE